jgi:ElaB/YqjD/DUF883 family membrane-anchored ribosome-binding protein
VNQERKNIMDTTRGEIGMEVGHADHDTKSGALRAKLDAAAEKAKAAYDRVHEKTVAAAKAADKTVRDHPYQAIGVAFGLGLLVGVLAMRSRRD